MEGAIWKLKRVRGPKWQVLKLEGQNENTPLVRRPKVDFSLIIIICFGLVKVVADKIRVGDGKVPRFANTPELG